MMRLQGFMGLRSLAKQIQSSFNKSSGTLSRAARVHANTQSTSFKACRCLFISFKMKAFRSYLMIFISLRSFNYRDP